MYISNVSSDSAFENFKFHAAYLRKSAEGYLYSEKYGINFAAAKSPEKIASEVSWHAEEWMGASHKISWCVWAEREMEKLIMDSLTFCSGWDEVAQKEMDVTAATICEDAEFNAALDAGISHIKRIIASEAMRIVFAGVESSSNPMTIINSKSCVEAAKSALEVLCDMANYNAVGHEQVNDIINGNERRKEERKKKITEQKSITPDKVMVTKSNGVYTLVAINKLGDQMATKVLAVTRKPDALSVARQWAEDLRNAALDEAESRGWITDGYGRFQCSAPTIES